MSADQKNMIAFGLTVVFAVLVLVLGILPQIAPQPVAPPTPVAAPSPSPPLPLEQRVRALEEQEAAPESKDFWDKLAAVSGLVGALATASIAGIGIYATHVYNQRQQALERVQQTRQQAIEQAQLIQNLMQPR